jgi:hypothetical protein
VSGIDTTKELLSEHRFRIKLYDEVLTSVDAVLSATSEERFPKGANFSPGAFCERIMRYEGVTGELIQTQALIAFWGEPFHLQLLSIPARRLSGASNVQSGNSFVSVR